MTAPPEAGAELEAVASLLKRHGREFFTRFEGRSMEPTLPSGAEVLLRCPATAAVGEIVAFARGGRVVVHRVVAAAPDGAWLLTRGDAHALPDPLLTDREAVIGSVVKLRRGDGLAEPAGAPASLGRRLALRACTLALSAGPGFGRGVIGGLLALRRWLWLVPRTGLARLLGRR